MTPPNIPDVGGADDTSAFELPPDSDEEDEDRADWEVENQPVDAETNALFAEFGISGAPGH